MDQEIMDIIKELNSMKRLPPIVQRRNSVYYPFFTYINHTIALLISGNYSGVALFIRRACKELVSMNSKNLYPGSEQYLDLCEDYLRKLFNYLLRNNLLPEDVITDFNIDELRIVSKLI